VPNRSLRPSPIACNRRVNALEFIRRYFLERGKSPCLREIGNAVGASVQGASVIVKKLEESGDIIRGKGGRSIRLPDRADELSDSELLLLVQKRGYLVIQEGKIQPLDG
jgi:SOS-response transcriptional repressor LexA